MEIKKKLKKYLKSFGMPLKMAILFMLVLSFQLILSTSCYASISDDYLTYALNQLKSYNGSYSSVMTNCLNVCIQNKSDIITHLSDFETQNNITNISNRNYSFFISSVDRYSAGFYIVISNSGAGSDNLNFIDLYDTYITPHENDGSKLYLYEFRVSSSSNYIGYYTPYVLSYGQLSTYIRTSYSINNDNSVLTMSVVACSGLPAVYWRYNFSANGIVYPVILLDSQGNFYIEPDEPEEPSGDVAIGGTGTITNNSGDTTGKIDLSGIEQGIENLQNQISGDTQKVLDNQNQNTETIVNTISGEVTKVTNTLTESADDTINNTNITSGDFANIVDFTPITNNQEYTAISNLWYELLNGFSNALTNVNRTLYIEFMGENYPINLDDFSVFIPASLKVFFGTLCTVWVVIYISKNTKHLVEDIQTASIDNVANKLTEDFESNMF